MLTLEWEEFIKLFGVRRLSRNESGVGLSLGYQRSDGFWLHSDDKVDGVDVVSGSGAVSEKSERDFNKFGIFI